MKKIKFHLDWEQKSEFEAKDAYVHDCPVRLVPAGWPVNGIKHYDASPGNVVTPLGRTDDFRMTFLALNWDELVNDVKTDVFGCKVNFFTKTKWVFEKEDK